MVALVAPAIEKQVVDGDNVVIGRIRDARFDPRTHGVRALVVRLNSDVRRRMARPMADLVVPMRRVVGIRRDEVTLDRTFEELQRGAAMPDIPDF